jgi:hypothetical protein
LATLLVDPNPGHARGYRAVDKMDDAVGILDHTKHLALADPAGIKRLSTALGVKECGPQHDGEFVLVGHAVQYFHVGIEVITVEKEAKRHVPNPDKYCFLL